MGKIFCILGKSSTGKDTIYKRLLQQEKITLQKIVPYTTRPIRDGERNGVEYFFTTTEELEELRRQGKVIECRSYQTYHGEWSYYTVEDSQIDLAHNHYIVIGTLESFVEIRKYFGKERVLPIYIAVEDGERLHRALQRERNQEQPKYEEMCRRFLADQADFSDEKIKEAGIKHIFYNDNLEECLAEIENVIRQST